MTGDTAHRFEVLVTARDDSIPYLNPKILNMEESIGRREMRLSLPELLAGRWVTPVVRVLHVQHLGDIFSCGPMVLVSDRVTDVIRQFCRPDEVELLPVEVIKAGRGYFLLHVLKQLDYLDTTRTKGKKFLNSYMFISSDYFFQAEFSTTNNIFTIANMASNHQVFQRPLSEEIRASAILSQFVFQPVML